MSDNDEKVQQDLGTSEQNNNVVDMLLSKNQHQTLDSDTMILETQKRVWGALKRL
ncbi:unnamed protein product [marine sediment metagenome]|uniref:Uncharacterized protein n=1 Tax=marine sediment metagenome TaxID=412755 RepID=X0YFE5_9ZZZZ